MLVEKMEVKGVGIRIFFGEDILSKHFKGDLALKIEDSRIILIFILLFKPTDFFLTHLTKLTQNSLQISEGQ